MVDLPDIHAEGERIVAETYKPKDGGYLWTDVVGAVQTAIAEERARHISPDKPDPAPKAVAWTSKFAMSLFSTGTYQITAVYEKRDPWDIPLFLHPDPLSASLIEAFKHADASDWDFLLSLLNKSVRHGDDAQTKFWVSAMKKARSALTQEAGR